MSGDHNINTYFCRDQGTFRSFVGAIVADGGADGPEDIMGGLNKTFWKLSWREEASKVKKHMLWLPVNLGSETGAC
jgi:hypothetical protein